MLCNSAQHRSELVNRPSESQLNWLGDLELSEGRAQAARDFYQKGLELRTRIAAALPDDMQAQRDLGISYDRFGSLEDQAVEQQIEWKHRALAVDRRLLSLQPASAESRRDIAIDCRGLSSLLLKSGRTDESRSFRNECLAMLREMRSLGMFLDPPMVRLLAHLEAE